jgi:hypothetical protein
VCVCVCVSVCVRDKKRGKGGYVCVGGRGPLTGLTMPASDKSSSNCRFRLANHKPWPTPGSLSGICQAWWHRRGQVGPERSGKVPGSALTDGEGLSGRPRPLCRERAEMLSSAATVLHSFVASLSMQICDGHMQDANLRNVARRLGARIRCVDSYYRGDGPCAD